MSDLAVFGGAPVRKDPFPAYRSHGGEEREAVARVMDSGILSGYIGAWHPAFYGGPEVRAFEAEWSEKMGGGHAVAVNSCTSGLYSAVGAVGAGPGEEVIVSPYTMSASVTAAVAFNAVPVFADIDPVTYCLDPASIEARITERTKAIIVVHIFGQAADMDAIMAIARPRGIKVIEDCAQIPFGTYKGRSVGLLGDLGVFSLNYHKHIHTGEGGVVTTRDADLCERVQLIRNHAESVVAGKQTSDIVNMVGFNYRLGELEAAIGRCQIRKADALVAERKENVRAFERMIDGLPGVTPPVVGAGGDHVYYVHALDYDAEALGVDRARFIHALKAELAPTVLREGEGPLIGAGYVKPLYLLPMFQQRLAYGKQGCPFSCPLYEGEARYDRGLCPNAERAHFERVITHEYIRPGMREADLRDFADALIKVAENAASLHRIEL